MSIRGITSFLTATIMVLVGASMPVSAKNLVNTAYDRTFLITEVGMEEDGGIVKVKLNDLDYDIGDGVVTSFEGYRTKDNMWVLGWFPVVYKVTGERLDEDGELEASSVSEIEDQDLLKTGWMAFFFRIAGDEHFFILDLRECSKFRDIDGATCKLDENPKGQGHKYWAYLGDVKITDENKDDLTNSGGDGDEGGVDGGDNGGGGDNGDDDEDLGEGDDEGAGKGGGGGQNDGEDELHDELEDEDEEDMEGEDEADGEVEESEEVEIVNEAASMLSISGVGEYTGDIKQTRSIGEDEESEELDEGVVGGVQEEDEIVNPPVGVVTGVKFGWMWLFWLTALVSIFWFIIALFKRRKKEEDEKAVAASGK